VSLKPDKPAPEGGDIFAHIARTRGPLPPGEYAAEFVIHHPFETAKTKGATARIKIVDGDYQGREILLRFMQEGPATVDGIIARDAEALHSWWNAAGVAGPPAADFEAVLKRIWKASRNKRAILRIGVQTDRAAVGGMFLMGVRADDRYDF
jgi:hypothetical protein